ncbi:MAG: hypothetical protein JWM68_116 [Verrucomicrobiales bacterium]|nr:hypothetical protein [Verrucomicrobiales bacterium]
MYLTQKQAKVSKKAGFTFTDLITLVAVVTVVLVLIIPAMARTKVNSPAAVCLNNMRQLSSAWMMYSAENNGGLVWSYPGVGTPAPSAWCAGNAAASNPDSAGSYFYQASDPAGLITGRLWPYVKSLSTYKCGADRRVTTAGGIVKPVLRSYSMNSYMAGRSYGDPSGSSYVVTDSGAQTTVFRVYLKENEIRYPAKTFVFLDEDAASINDSMFLVDMGTGLGLVDLPGRQHDSGYGINFADGHASIFKLLTPEARNWVPGSPLPHTNADYLNLTNMATAPQL